MLAAVSGYHTHLWDVTTGKHLRELMPHPYLAGIFRHIILFAHDGRTIMGVSSDRMLASWDVATGKKIRTIYTADAGKCIKSFVASPDGKQLLVEIGKDGEVKAEDAYLLIHQLQLWDLAQGKLVRSFQKQKYHKEGGGGYLGCLAFAPNGQTVAAADDIGTIVLWDVATGKILREIPRVNRRWAASDVAFSADSRSIISIDNRISMHMNTSNELRELSLRIRDVVTGKERLSIPDACGGLTISTDGRTLGMFSGAGGISLLEMMTGKELLRYEVKKNMFKEYAFGPDSKTLIFLLRDGYVLIWDLTPADWNPPTAPLSNHNLRALWKTLADNDAKTAYRAILTLSAQPAQTLPFLKDHLAPVPAERPQRIRQLIAQLDDDTFKRREAASTELARLGPQAESALRETLTASPSTELRSRVRASPEIT